MLLIRSFSLKYKKPPRMSIGLPRPRLEPGLERRRHNRVMMICIRLKKECIKRQLFALTTGVPYPTYDTPFHPVFAVDLRGFNLTEVIFSVVRWDHSSLSFVDDTHNRGRQGGNTLHHVVSGLCWSFCLSLSLSLSAPPLSTSPK